jgi:hypothetical protein
MSELKQAEKLKALGIKAASAQANPYSDLFAAIADAKTWSEFQTDVGSFSSFSSFEDYLVNEIGVDATEAELFRKRLEQKYASYSDFDAAIQGYADYAEWINTFSWGETIASESTTDGEKAAMDIRFHSEPGVTRDGLDVPAGTLELFGNRIQTAQTGAVAQDEEEPSGGSTKLFEWSNVSVSPTTPRVGETITVSGDLTNNSSYREPFLPTLQVDGEVVKEGDFTKIGPGSTRTFTFSYFSTEVGEHAAQLNASPKVTFTIIYSGL